MVLDNRELALVGWLGLLFVFALVNRTGRSALTQLAAAFLKVPLVLIFLSMVVYVAGLVFLLHWARLWTLPLISETVLWFFGPAVILLSRFDRASNNPRFLREALLGVLKYTLILEFVMNLRPAGLLVEILLVPILTIVTLLHLVAGLKEEHRAVRTFMDILLAVFGLSLFLYTVVGVVQDPREFATYENLLELLVPILLTLAFVPFVYVVAVLTTYGRLFSLMNWKLSENPSLARYAKWRLFLATLLRLKTLRRFDKCPWRLVASMDKPAIRRVVSRFQAGDTGPGG